MKNQYLFEYAIFWVTTISFESFGYKRDFIDNIDFSLVGAVVCDLWIQCAKSVYNEGNVLHINIMSSETI